MPKLKEFNDNVTLMWPVLFKSDIGPPNFGTCLSAYMFHSGKLVAMSWEMAGDTPQTRPHHTSGRRICRPASSTDLLDALIGFSTVPEAV